MKAICNAIISFFSAGILSLLLMSGSIHYLSHAFETEHCVHNGESHLHESPEPCGLCDCHFSSFHFSEIIGFTKEIHPPVIYSAAGLVEVDSVFFFTNPGRAPPVS